MSVKKKLKKSVKKTKKAAKKAAEMILVPAMAIMAIPIIKQAEKDD